MPRQQKKSSAAAVPQNLEEADDIVRKIGEEKRTIQEIETSLNDQVSKLTERARADSTPHEENIAALFSALFAYAEANREDLTAGGKKTVEVPSGKFRWRLTPNAIELIDPEERVIATLKKRKLHKYVRIKETVDKSALLKDPKVAASIKGVAIRQQEMFEVIPAEVEATITKPTDLLRAAV